MKVIERYYKQFDEEDKGYLTIAQARQFFALTLDLNYNKKSHRDTFRQTMKVIDPEGNRIIFKERILEFFEIGGFVMLSSLAEEQQNLDLSQSGRGEESELTDADASFQADEDTTNKLSKSQLEGVKVTMLPVSTMDNAAQTKG